MNALVLILINISGTEKKKQRIFFNPKAVIIILQGLYVQMCVCERLSETLDFVFAVGCVCKTRTCYQ